MSLNSIIFRSLSTHKPPRLIIRAYQSSELFMNQAASVSRYILDRFHFCRHMPVRQPMSAINNAFTILGAMPLNAHRIKINETIWLTIWEMLRRYSLHMDHSCCMCPHFYRFCAIIWRKCCKLWPRTEQTIVVEYLTSTKLYLNLKTHHLWFEGQVDVFQRALSVSVTSINYGYIHGLILL